MSGAVKIYGASILPSGATSPLQTPAIWHLGNCTLCATHYVGKGWQSFHKLNAIPPVVKLAARLAWRRIKAMIPAGWDWTQGAEMWRPSTHFGVLRFGSLTAFWPEEEGKGLTLVQALGSRGDRSLLIGWFLLRLSDFSLVGNITDHGRILYQTKRWNSCLPLNYDLVLIILN